MRKRVMFETATLVWKLSTALLPAISTNTAFLLPLLQVVSISDQPRRVYYKFSEPEP